MEHIHEMILGTEASIKKLFPQKWDKSSISFFISSPKFDVDISSLNKNLNIPIRDFVFRGGKRLRPVLFLTCLELFGLDYRKFFDIAAIIELLHNGTLVLDDIEDNGILRRGLPTCHIKFGLDTATNVGVSLHLLSLISLTKKQKQLSAEQLAKVWQIIVEELTNVSFGQALDIYWHKNKSIDEISLNKYLAMVSLKTGSLIRMSVRLACVIAEKDPKTSEVFTEFATNLGMAFQIIDDSLDIASSDQFGKAYGNDITEGKLSLPVIFSLKSLPPKEQENLVEILGKHTRDKRLLKEAITSINKSGAVKKSIDFADKLVNEAWCKLKRGWQKADLSHLEELTFFVIKRNN